MNNLSRPVRRNAVFIVIGLLIALVYSQRKSFVKVMPGAGGPAGSGDASACRTLCGATLASSCPACPTCAAAPAPAVTRPVGPVRR